jgi:hypothetical protein
VRLGIGSDTLFFWSIDDDFNPRSVLEDGSGLRDFTDFKMSFLEVAQERISSAYGAAWK